MTDRRGLAGLAFGAALLAASVGATTFSLPDVAGAPGATVNTQLRVNAGAGVAAINVSVLYNPTIADPTLAGITAGSAIDGTWTVRSNIVPVNASQSDLRIVVYRSPTAEFSNSPANRVVVTVPWVIEAGAAQGSSTALDFDTATLGRCGISNAAGVSVGGSFSDGRIVALTPPTLNDIAGGFEDLNNWTPFEALPFPFTDPRDGDYLIDSVVAGPALQLESTADGVADGLTGWLCVLPIDYVANSVYFCEWTLQNDLVPGQNEASFRLRFQEEVSNAFTETLITGFTSSRLGGSTVTYPQLFEPSDLSLSQGPGDANDDLYLAMDMVDFDDTQAMVLRLTAVDVARFDKNAAFENAFSTAFTVTDFTQANQWQAGLAGNVDLDPRGEGLLPAAPEFGTKTQYETLTPDAEDYIVSTTNVILHTDGVPSDAASLGFFQEFGIPVEAGLFHVPDRIWRHSVQATRPNNEGTDNFQQDTTGMIRLRFTEEPQALSVTYQVEPIGDRLNPGSPFISPATGSNRPLRGVQRTYNNYLLYPTTTNIEALLDNSGTDNILALVGLADFRDDIQGSVQISNVLVESAPRSALLP
ncbi:MAG: hypothetical protein HUU25_03935 [Candidatus Sumerlaeia bacterium]|nr:hypothetical protein [Candidatus Sumerlaeia bacterium]